MTGKAALIVYCTLLDQVPVPTDVASGDQPATWGAPNTTSTLQSPAQAMCRRDEVLRIYYYVRSCTAASSINPAVRVRAGPGPGPIEVHGPTSVAAVSLLSSYELLWTRCYRCTALRDIRKAGCYLFRVCKSGGIRGEHRRNDGLSSF